MTDPRRRSTATRARPTSRRDASLLTAPARRARARPARRTPASRASAARARSGSTASSSAPASSPRSRPTAARSARSRRSARRRLHPVQEAFLDAGAVQCGFCTPGLVVAVADLLERDPHPTERDDPRGARRQPLPLHRLPRRSSTRSTSPRRRRRERRRRAPAGVGESARRIDGVPKVTGDVRLRRATSRAEGMLWGVDAAQPARLRTHPRRSTSPRPRGRAGRRRRAHGRRLPGSHDVRARVLPTSRCSRSDVVRYEGEPVALVAAETPRAGAPRRRRDRGRLRAAAGCDRHGAGAPARRAAACTNSATSSATSTFVHGDPESAEADVWVEGYYETGDAGPGGARPRGRPRRPRRTTAASTSTSRRSGCTSTGSRSRRASACPRRRCGITLAGVGGAFGSREDIHMQIHACLLALAHRPAGEDGLRAGGVLPRSRPPPPVADVDPLRRDSRRAARRRRRPPAARRRRLRVVVAGRCSRTRPPSPPARTRCRTSAIEGTVVYTNNPPCGAMRGFGAPQVCFAYESAMDELAAKLGIDPLELRLRNAVRTGSVLPTGQVLDGQRAGARGDRALPRDPAAPRSPSAGRDAIAYPGGAGTSAAARRCGAASASPSASRTSPTARVSTTQPRRP